MRCADLKATKDGRRVEVAGIILVRQKPGSAKGVLFITIEDETGVANIILWPDRFEAQRTVVMSSAMISVVGTVQREGEVIHVIADRINDLTGLLRHVGDIDLPRLTSPGDGATHGGSPDRGEPGWQPKAAQPLSSAIPHRLRPRGRDPDPKPRFPLKRRLAQWPGPPLRFRHSTIVRASPDQGSPTASFNGGVRRTRGWGEAATVLTR